MAHLCRQQAKALSEGDDHAARRLEEKQHRFAWDHLFIWVEEFCQALKAGATTQFFKGIAQMLLAFVVMEKKIDREGDNSVPAES